MSEKKWVQHISGKGEKWEVISCVYNDMDHNGICVVNQYDPKRIGRYLYLPKFEYVLCDPPEEWEDVTEECTWSDSGYHELYLRAANGNRVEANCLSPSLQGYLYRVRKVRCAKATGVDNPDWAFIVERRKS